LRICFNADERSIPPIIRNMIRSPRPGDPHNSRINDNSLIWKLIEYGFLLSDNQDVDRVRGRVPIEFVPDFERGFSL